MITVAITAMSAIAPVTMAVLYVFIDSVPFCLPYEVRAAEFMISHQGIVETGVVVVTVVSETGGSVTGADVSEDVVTGSAGFITGTVAVVCAAVVCGGAAVTVSGADEAVETVVTAGAVV